MRTSRKAMALFAGLALAIGAAACDGGGSDGGTAGGDGGADGGGDDDGGGARTVVNVANCAPDQNVTAGQLDIYFDGSGGADLVIEDEDGDEVGRTGRTGIDDPLQIEVEPGTYRVFCDPPDPDLGDGELVVRAGDDQP